MKKDFNIVLNGKNGVFRTENRLNIFAQHVESKSFTEEMKAIRAEIVKMAKRDEVSIDLNELVDYSTHSKYRLIVRRWDLELEVRPITRMNDFSDITTYKFTSESERMKYIMNFIKGFATELFENDIPEKSYYAQTL